MAKKLGFLVCVVFCAFCGELDMEKAFLANSEQSSQSVDQNAPDQEMIKACDLLAKLNQNDKEIDYIRAHELYDGACENSDFHACYCLGGMYEFVAKLGNNLKKSHELYTKACNGGSNLGCKSAMKLEYGIKF